MGKLLFSSGELRYEWIDGEINTEYEEEIENNNEEIQYEK